MDLYNPPFGNSFVQSWCLEEERMRELREFFIPVYVPSQALLLLFIFGE
jgi:hypothetical protein